MHSYLPTFQTSLVKALLNAASDPSSPVYQKALAALQKDRRRIDKEEAEDRQEAAQREARRHPALTTQKVIASLRKARLSLSHYDSRGGTSEGLAVSYGDFERTFVKVSYAFTWNFEFNHQIKKDQAKAAKHAIVNAQLLTLALTILQNAGLQVTAFRDDNPHLARLEVRS